jgi:hypothetical protein
MNTFKLKQWQTKDHVQEVEETFEGTVREYFEEHMNRIRQQGIFKVINSSIGDSGFFIELSVELSDTIKCTATLVQEREETK